MSVPWLACMAAVAAFYHLPPRVLPSIQAVEDGRVGSIAPNPNGTADLGVMQVNTIWIGPLAQVAHMAPDAVQTRLVMDPCFNIAAAGLILHSYRREASGDLMTAIRWYHSHTPALGEAYLAQVVRSARLLFVAPRPSD